MLDENLPTFYLRPSNDDTKHHASLLLSYQGSEPTLAYTLKHLDPASPASRNCYAIALYDSYHPDILFGEILLTPDWTAAADARDETHGNGSNSAAGGSGPPQPVLPTEFCIQLYNPNQQIVVRMKHSVWGSPSWEFEMPQQSFRQPSISTLDRTQDDPTAAMTTPKITFCWKKDGKLSKDYVCMMTGKSTNVGGKKSRSKEPDITLALFRQFKSITMYESNISRIEIEDPKGLEVILLLGAMVIRDVYNHPIHQAFNISDTASPRSPTMAKEAHAAKPHGSRHRSSSLARLAAHAPSDGQTSPAVMNGALPESSPSPRKGGNAVAHDSLHQTTSALPPTDPRTQWEIDAETARLKKKFEHEERKRIRAEAAETKKVKKLLEQEEREARERRREQEREIDEETERLRKLFAQEQQIVAQNQQQYQGQNEQTSHTTTPSHDPHRPPSTARPNTMISAPYVAHNLRPPSSQFHQSSTSLLTPDQPSHLPYTHGNVSGASASSPYLTNEPRRSSIWNMFSSRHAPSHNDSNRPAGTRPGGGRLSKTRSMVF